METVLLDEIIEKTERLTDAERQRLIRFLQRKESGAKPNGGAKKIVQPNIEWLKKHRGEYGIFYF